ASVGWWAESNGEEVRYMEKRFRDGELVEFEVRRSFAPGTFIRINEWYMCKEIGLNEGLKLSPQEVAEGIVEIEKQMLEQGWISQPVRSGPADGQIFQTTRTDVDSIADTMA